MKLGLIDVGGGLRDIYGAGVLILEEAGGRVTDIGGGGDWPANGFIATNGTLHPALLGCFPEKRSQPRRSSR